MSFCYFHMNFNNFHQSAPNSTIRHGSITIPLAGMISVSYESQFHFKMSKILKILCYTLFKNPAVVLLTYCSIKYCALPAFGSEILYVWCRSSFWCVFRLYFLGIGACHDNDLWQHPLFHIANSLLSCYVTHVSYFSVLTIGMAWFMNSEYNRNFSRENYVISIFVHSVSRWVMHLLI